MLWLMTQFGQEKIETMKTLLPVPDHFPITFDGSEDSARATASIVARQMDIDPSLIHLTFYAEHILEIRGDAGPPIFTQHRDNASAGLYHGKDADGKYLVSIEKMQLKSPEKLVATLAHEFAHIKILGEGRLQENDEYLTDLVTVFFGCGIFNANGSGSFYNSREGFSYNMMGYLPQQQWGYALALYAYIRRERQPEWVKYLTGNLRSDFKKSEGFIWENEGKVLTGELPPTSTEENSGRGVV